MNFLCFVDTVDKQYPITMNLVKNLNVIMKKFGVSVWSWKSRLCVITFL